MGSGFRSGAGICLAALVLSVSLAGCGSSAPDLSNDKGPTPGVPSNLPTATALPVVTAPTAAQFKAALLTTIEMNALRIGTFTGGPVGDATTSSGCAAVDVFANAVKTAQTRVGINFQDRTAQLSAQEQIILIPNTSDVLFGALKDGINSCPTLTADGSVLGLQVLDDPEVDGADETLAVQASSTVAGKTITVNIEMARFDDTVLWLTYGGPLTTSQGNRAMNSFFSAALSKGLSVLTS
jgi:hypothetical protein